MKCIILGLDGLEYNLVREFDLVNLKQVEYGKVRIPRECYIEVKSPQFEKPLLEPYTPQVWFSFLTGSLPTREHGYKYGLAWESWFLNVLRDLSAKVGLDRVKGKGIFLRMLGFKKRAIDIRDYNIPTIFDLAEKSIDINVPVFSRGWTFGLHMKPQDFEDFEDFITAALEKQLDHFYRIKKKTLDSLKRRNDWELLMAYTKLLDFCGELCFSNVTKLREMYLLVDDFAKKVKDLSGESFILIISDHGMERLGNTPFGKHSEYGFYSVNQPIGLKNPVITSFYSLIKKVLSSKTNHKTSRQKTYQ